MVSGTDHVFPLSLLRRIRIFIFRFPLKSAQLSDRSSTAAIKSPFGAVASAGILKQPLLEGLTNKSTNCGCAAIDCAVRFPWQRLKSARKRQLLILLCFSNVCYKSLDDYLRRLSVSAYKRTKKVHALFTSFCSLKVICSILPFNDYADRLPVRCIFI